MKNVKTYIIRIIKRKINKIIYQFAKQIQNKKRSRLICKSTKPEKN